MHAQRGDWLVVKGIHVDVPEHRGRIVAVGSPDGGPPFTVRWQGADHESTVFPGPDAIVLTDAEMAAQDEQARERVEGLGALQHHLPSGA
ncbi:MULTISPECIES: DUF1918 domain-containing protein [unclassified Amycolatopsis]|uniref:DUF1918 domain-containing protein n=1 Tax=unclassified Amycolatopsis TaxID=2618356 RepID=UPI0005628DCB|nr:DUF1918 domain-containing protein [Amycolatopsis sp. Poz14]MCG3755262.1 DUF1918 domain-containing protein [Amycolatopsis sp. Poz14]